MSKVYLLDLIKNVSPMLLKLLSHFTIHTHRSSTIDLSRARYSFPFLWTVFGRGFLHLYVLQNLNKSITGSRHMSKVVVLEVNSLCCMCWSMLTKTKSPAVFKGGMLLKTSVVQPQSYPGINAKPAVSRRYTMFSELHLHNNNNNNNNSKLNRYLTSAKLHCNKKVSLQSFLVAYICLSAFEQQEMTNWSAQPLR